MEQILTKHFLYPGALLISKKPHEVSTILGSCVAVCLYDPVLRIGGINHYMMPFWNGEGLSSPKYGNIAIQKLIEKMLTLGSHPKNIQGKIFGGASQLEYSNQLMNIGERNILLAFEMLKSNGIAVVGSSVGGRKGRKILFHTGTGQVLMRYVKSE